MNAKEIAQELNRILTNYWCIDESCINCKFSKICKELEDYSKF